jgi:hypothetical protein
MGLTDLLDQLTKVGPELAGPVGWADLANGEADARNEVNAALLPVWQWLDGLKPVADENNVNWIVLDSAPTDEAITAVKAIVAVLVESAENADTERLSSEITLLGTWLNAVADQTDERLKESGVDAERRNRLLLPLRAHISELAVNRGSSEALSLARQSLGQVGERQLSEGIAEKVNYEQKRADWFRAFAVLSFTVSIAWLIASYLAFGAGSLSESDQVTRVIGRLAIGSAVFALAVYLSREAGGHRTRAAAWQSVQLQMDTIDLYCASLPPAHKDAIRLSFGLEVFSGSRLFGSLGLSPPQDGQNEPGTALDLAQAVSLAKALSGTQHK